MERDRRRIKIHLVPSWLLFSVHLSKVFSFDVIWSSGLETRERKEETDDQEIIVKWTSVDERVTRRPLVSDISFLPSVAPFYSYLPLGRRARKFLNEPRLLATKKTDRHWYLFPFLLLLLYLSPLHILHQHFFTLPPSPVWIPAVSSSGRWPNQLKFTKGLNQLNESDGVGMRKEWRGAGKERKRLPQKGRSWDQASRSLLKWFQSQIEDKKQPSLCSLIREWEWKESKFLMCFCRRRGRQTDR